jgi:uncharacterized protein
VLAFRIVNDSHLVQIAERAVADGLDWSQRLARLRAWLRSRSGVVVAYSGGVDSSLLLKVAAQELGPRALGVIGRSDSYAARELRAALEQAQAWGARVEVVSTGELSDPNFRSNPLNRCYFCKDELYRKLSRVARREGADTVTDGTIADDLRDHRPGRQAALEQGVESPLAMLGFSKADVRAAAESLGLAAARKPASPCLASRIPYGTEITATMLAQIERAEDLLLALGFGQVRVRHHGETARIEVPGPDIARLCEPAMRERVAAGLRECGFRFVAVDLDGFRSGRLNPSVPTIVSGQDQRH